MPAETTNTEDTVAATKKSAEREARAAARTTAEEDARKCDYCHVEMKPVRQLNLNDVVHDVLACTNDPKHTKNVPA